MIGRNHLFATGLVLASALASGCGKSAAGPAGEAVRPKDPTAAQAMGENAQGAEGGADCSKVSEDARPFLADWKTDDRATLESAMQDSVAVISYTCKGIKPLPDCKLPGSSYGFAQIEIKKDDLIIDQSSDLAATIPFSMISIGGEIQRGLKLKLRYALIGRRATQPEQILRSELKGGNKCEGATHFVRAAWVGAFEFGTATEGKAGASAKVLGAGAEGHSASAKQMERAEGDLKTCKADAAANGKAPSGCGGLVRLQLGPIVEKIKGHQDEAPPDMATGSQKSVDARNPCSIGYVLGADGECKKRSGATAYLCDPKNKDECVSQCEKGSAESCHNAAGAIMRTAKPDDWKSIEKDALVYWEKGCNGNYAPSCTAQAGRVAMSENRDVVKARELYEKGCKLGDPNACSSLAYASESPFLTADSKAFQASPTAAFKYMDQACNLGAGYACADVARRYIGGLGVLANPEAGVKSLEKACRSGATMACTTLADHLATGKAGVNKDPKRALQIYHDNCEKKNVGSACFGAAMLYREGAGDVKKDPEKAKQHLEHACNNLKHGSSCAALGTMYENGELGQKNPTEAIKAYTAGCPAEKTFPNEACYALAELLDKGGKDVPKNPDRAAQAYSRACTQGDFGKPALDKITIGTGEKACRKSIAILKKQKKTNETVSPLARLCYSYGDKKACDERKKLAGNVPAPPGPPKGPPGAKPPPPPPPPPGPKSATK